MATVTIVDKFPKSTFSHADVSAERSLRLSITGVISSVITDDEENWILTTVFNAGADASAETSVTAAAASSSASGSASAVAPTSGSTLFGSLVPGGFFSSDPSDHRVPRSIRTNNPGALNISKWQRTRPGFVGTTEPDGSANHNVTTIYRTPEHGIGSWFHLISVIYGFGATGHFTVEELAQHYAGTASGAAVTGYVSGWSHFSGGALTGESTLSLANDADMLLLGKAMFGHEAGKQTPLHDDQITFAVQHERSGTLPA